MKNKHQNFKMININNEKVISYKSFEEFIFNILDMYHQTLSQKVDADRDSIKRKFYEISNGKETLSYEDYYKALDKNPRLFDWLEKPKEMIHDILNETIYEKENVDKLIKLVFDYISK